MGHLKAYVVTGSSPNFAVVKVVFAHSSIEAVQLVADQYHADEKFMIISVEPEV